MKKLFLVIALLLIPFTARAADETITIRASDDLSKDTVTIDVGDYVTWKNIDDEFHVIDAGDAVPIYPGESYRESFYQPGTIEYVVDDNPYRYKIIVIDEDPDQGDDRDTPEGRALTDPDRPRAIAEPNQPPSEDFPPSNGERINNFEQPSAPPPGTCPDGSTTNYPQCLFGINGNEDLIPDASYLPQIQDSDLSGKELLLLITRFILGFVGAVALLIMVIGGFMYLMARGDEGQTDKAKDTIIGAVIGIIIILAAWTIVTTVLNITERRGGNQFLPGNSQKK